MSNERPTCQACGHDEMPVIERRGRRRRRECTKCKHRVTTYEVTADRLAQLEAIEQHATAIAEAMADTTKPG